MEQTKIYSEANILKAWAYLNEGKYLKIRGGIHCIVDDQNIVHFIISTQEFLTVIENHAIKFDKDNDRFFYSLLVESKRKKYQQPHNPQELF